jgi:HTH-type transcriptional regulator/antitoxin HigA
MDTLKYTVIKSEAQYQKYCNQLEKLLDSGAKTKSVSNEIELLTLLIETWDNEHNTFNDADPIEILKSLMKDHKMKSVDLATLLGVSEGLVSDMLKYKKGLSKETIRILAERFKISQEAFNRPYELVSPLNEKLKDARVMNTTKRISHLTQKIA